MKMLQYYGESSLSLSALWGLGFPIFFFCQTLHLDLFSVWVWTSDNSALGYWDGYLEAHNISGITSLGIWNFASKSFYILLYNIHSSAHYFKSFKSSLQKRVFGSIYVTPSSIINRFCWSFWYVGLVGSDNFDFSASGT